MTPDINQMAQGINAQGIKCWMAQGINAQGKMLMAQGMNAQGKMLMAQGINAQGKMLMVMVAKPQMISQDVMLFD